MFEDQKNSAIYVKNKMYEPHFKIYYSVDVISFLLIGPTEEEATLHFPIFLN